VLKWIAPIAERLRQLPRPRMFSVSGHTEPNPDQPTTGQRLAEQTAAGIGSWRFIGIQAGVMVLWVLINTLSFTVALHFDQYPFVFLNLAMSAEAAFTGPILLIAANVGAIRDHAQANRIEKLTAQNEQMAEQNRQLVEQMCNLERMVDEHIAASAQAHSAEIADLATLVRAIHTAVTTQQVNGNVALPLATPDPTVVSPAESETLPAPSQPQPVRMPTSARAPQTVKPTRRRR
jgi:uncharacterized membrane protein